MRRALISDIHGNLEALEVVLDDIRTQRVSEIFTPDEIDLEYTLGVGEAMVNVGSVRQPRDGDDRACYVILEDGLDGDAKTGEPGLYSTATDPAKVFFRRLSYDLDESTRKMTR